MYKKAWCTCKVVVLLIKPIVFLRFSLPSASLDLKVPIIIFGRQLPTFLYITVLRPLVHPAAICCVLLGVVAQSLKPVKLLTHQLQHFFCSVIAEAKHKNVGSILQFFLPCWGHTRASHMLYLDFTKSYGLYSSHNALERPTLLEMKEI